MSSPSIYESMSESHISLPLFLAMAYLFLPAVALLADLTKPSLAHFLAPLRLYLGPLQHTVSAGALLIRMLHYRVLRSQ
eukprot:scaffold127448_cov25-Prasinocladus_malaysianus.AAC.1